MAFSFVAFTAWSAGVHQPGGGTTYTSVALPTGVQDGDLLVASCMGFCSSGGGYSPPAGWSTNVNNVSTGNNQPLMVATKVASSEPSTYTFTSSQTGWPLIIIYAIRGSAASSPILGSASSAQAGATSIAPPSYSESQSTSLLIYGYGGTDSGSSGSATITLPSPGNLLSGSSTGQQQDTSNGTCYGIISCTSSSAPGSATSSAVNAVSFVLEVAVGGPAISPAVLPPAMTGVAYSETLSASGGTSPYTWSISSGSLPGWASLNSSTGVISGTPPAGTLEYSPSFTVEVTDSLSATGTQAYVLQVGLFLQSAWPGFPAPALFVPGEIIIQSHGTQHTATLATEIGLLAALTRQVNPVEKASVAVIASQSRSVKKNVSATVALPAMILRGVTRTLTAVFAAVTVLLRIPNRTLTSSIAVTATITAVRQRIAVLVASLAITVSMQRKIGRVLAAAAALTTSLPRNITHSFTAPVAVTASQTQIKVRQLMLTAVTAMTSTAVRTVKPVLTTQSAITGNVKNQVGQTYRTVIAVTPNVSRSVIRNIAAVIALAVTQSQIKVQTVILSASVAVKGVAVRKVMPILRSSVILIPGNNTRTINRTIQGTLGIAGQTARGIGRVFTAPISVTGKINASRAYIIAVSTVMSVSAKTIRMVFSMQQTGIAVDAAVSRFIKTRVSTVLGLIPSVIPGRPFVVTLAANIAVAASITAQSFATAFVVTFKTGITAVRWVIGQAKTRWKTGP